jgi:hypothetical protein
MSDWPEWLCRWLTRHALTQKWANYNDDLGGLTCRCGKHYSIGYIDGERTEERWWGDVPHWWKHQRPPKQS